MRITNLVYLCVCAGMLPFAFVYPLFWFILRLFGVCLHFDFPIPIKTALFGQAFD